MIKFDLLVA